MTSILLADNNDDQQDRYEAQEEEIEQLKREVRALKSEETKEVAVLQQQIDVRAAKRAKARAAWESEG
jgi:uncharacterized protein YecE (DUF72 family)